jgi:glycosyltransferase involved in cell wall biosynthesis
MKISVVIPAYNAERFLPRCLASVFAQTLAPYEVIVVDDGSTDGTAQIAEELGATVVRRANGGAAAARNTGVRHATGEWIAMLDADDWWDPRKLALQAAVVGAGTVLVYTGIRLFDDIGDRGVAPATDSAVAMKILRYQNPISPSSVLVSRLAALSCGGFRESTPTCEDWGLWFRLRSKGDFVAIREPLTHYFVHRGSLSASPEKMLQGFRTIVNSTLLADLRGPRRWIWKQRIWATQLRSAALIARDNHLRGELGYLLRSLAAWPSPFWQPGRFACLASCLKQKISRPNGRKDVPASGGSMALGESQDAGDVRSIERNALCAPQPGSSGELRGNTRPDGNRPGEQSCRDQ